MTLSWIEIGKLGLQKILFSVYLDIVVGNGLELTTYVEELRNCD